MSASSAAVSRLSRGMDSSSSSRPWIQKTGLCSCFPLEDVAVEDPLLSPNLVNSACPRHQDRPVRRSPTATRSRSFPAGQDSILIKAFAKSPSITKEENVDDDVAAARTASTRSTPVAKPITWRAVASLTGGSAEENVGTDTVTVTKDNITAPEIGGVLYKTKCS